MRLAAPVVVIACLLVAGCTSNDPEDDLMMGSGTFDMELLDMPAGPLAPGQSFNVTVQAMHGMGMGRMGSMMSDHIGAHYWNGTRMDPTNHINNGTACVHHGGQLPGTYMAQCTAPMQPGTYHLRSHARMMDGEGQMHHWWSDEQTFTVA